MIAVKYFQTDFLKRPMVNITFESRLYKRYENGTLAKFKVIWIH